MADGVLTDLIAERGVLMVDGATGTQLMAAGLAAGDAPERLNLDRPEAVHGLHRSYVDVGSDIVLMLPVFAVPLVASVAWMNAGVGLWTPVRSSAL